MRKATMQDIANKAGVSKTTVSMVINNKGSNISSATKEKIFKIAQELNYIPNSIARSLSTKKSGTIGIMVPDITNPFFSEIARAIEDAANAYEYNVIFCNSDNEIDKEEKYIQLLISKLVDGVIFIAGGKSTKSIDILNANGVPFVLVDRYVEGYENNYGVYTLNKEGIIDGVDYLYKENKRKIVFVSGSSDLEISNLRLDGYTEAMKNHGIYDKSLIFESDFTIEGGRNATEEILKNLKDFDAIFYSNDVMALGGIKVLTRHGYKIPEDVSIIGFDNIHLSQIVEPELTTVGQPIYDIGRESCKLLIDVINENDIPEKVISFKTELIKRGTVK
ncbi:LacI family DNA-binding transcriptional regulator [Oceanirhabdus sp. W0125-5]|uniref:LacI family DNA-binding transcriptional regulator n=1 Tax=Oceanirhabdus sp. W0125-5 TaxID=2999116 RepID=UPI0022F2C732|nr:LacI family DNA-binding transcriptional regulator [Oceanirhabdus sp. W0125-5]WBW99027.1 LacI family DNA-binding transcriptional regulator [Oceanirhabdus sp. W0125-5]